MTAVEPPTPDPVTVVTPRWAGYLPELRKHLLERHGRPTSPSRDTASTAAKHRAVCQTFPRLITAECAGFHAEHDPAFALWLTGHAQANAAADRAALAPAVPHDIMAAAVTSIEAARVTLGGLSWLLHRAAARNRALTVKQAEDIRAHFGDLRNLLTAAEAALPPPPRTAPWQPKRVAPWHGTERPEGLDETLAGAREAFFAGMADRDPAELERDRQAAWTPRPGTWWAGTGEDGTCNCSDPRGATPGDQCFNCGYTLTAAQIERGDEIERRSPQAAADWNAANPGNDDQ
jgi:hypothetical protein